MVNRKHVVSGRKKVINVVPSHSVFTAVTDICESFRIDKTTFVNTVLVLYLNNPTWFGYVDNEIDHEEAILNFKKMMAELPKIAKLGVVESLKEAGGSPDVDAEYKDDVRNSITFGPDVDDH